MSVGGVTRGMRRVTIKRDAETQEEYLIPQGKHMRVHDGDEVAAGDHVFEDRGVRVIVDAESLRFVDGTEIDFVRQGLNEAFKFRNPNVKGECGCGESFNV